ncbi:MAG: tetratricopeptide (TPR) repeat protein [Candidatus Marinamargulisbacteria bacterium]|jgi:tetratricopeptide (TPR) repeat protein
MLHKKVSRRLKRRLPFSDQPTAAKRPRFELSVQPSFGRAHLPPELMCLIFEFSDSGTPYEMAKRRLTLGAVSRGWAQVSQDNLFWRRLYQKAWVIPHRPMHLSEPWVNFAMERFRLLPEPKNPGAFSREAITHLWEAHKLLDSNGQAAEAIPLLHRAVQIKPNSVTMLKGLALLYEKLSQPDKSLICYEQAFHINPTREEFLPQFSTFLNTHFPDQYPTFIQHLVANKFDHRECLSLALSYYQEAGPASQAHDVLMTMHREFSFEPDILPRCVASFLGLGRADDAVSFLDQDYKSKTEFDMFGTDLISTAKGYALVGNNFAARTILERLESQEQESLDWYEEQEMPGNQLHWMEMEESMGYIRENLVSIREALSGL